MLSFEGPFGIRAWDGIVAQVCGNSGAKVGKVENAIWGSK